MPEQESSPPARGVWKALAIVVAVLLAYQGVMFLVRRHVDELVTEVVGHAVPDFALSDLAGRVWTARELRGKRVVLQFFRSHCQGCAIEAPVIRELARRADPAKVVVLGVMLDEVQGFGPDATSRTLAEFGYEHPVLMADRAFVDAFHGVGWSHVTPITYVVDGDGKITAALRGHQSLETLLATVR